MLFQTNASCSSPVVIPAQSRGVQTDPQTDLERTGHMGNLCPAKAMIRYAVLAFPPRLRTLPGTE
jgi:hypothetical protein